MDQGKRKKEALWCFERSKLHHPRDPRFLYSLIGLILYIITSYMHIAKDMLNTDMLFSYSISLDMHIAKRHTGHWHVFCKWTIFSHVFIVSLVNVVYAVFYVVSKTSSFYKDFRSGKWTPPPWVGSIIKTTSSTVIFPKIYIVDNESEGILLIGGRKILHGPLFGNVRRSTMFNCIPPNQRTGLKAFCHMVIFVRISLFFEDCVLVVKLLIGYSFTWLFWSHET